MRFMALSLCTFALLACSSHGTEQTTGQVSGPDTLSSNPQAGGGVGGGGANDTNSADDAGGGGANGDPTVLSGCTLTQGYWKNHASAWPVISLTIGGVAYSQAQLLDIFGMSPGGDASLILAHQLIAALLNEASGAVPSAAVAKAISDAQTWMAANLGSNAGLPYGVSSGSAAGQEATQLSGTLDDFNSDHCGTGTSGDGGASGSSGGNGTTSSSGSGSGGGYSSGSSSGGASGGGNGTTSSSGGASGGGNGTTSSSGSGGSGGAGACVQSGGQCATSTDCCSGLTCASGQCGGQPIP
jgi:hypothetical protein